MTFDELNLNKPLLKALEELGFEHPTTIQQKAFSVIMSGQDVLGIAQTGTGKTFAYLLPTLRQWTFTKEKFPQILIIVPTRELVVQVVSDVEKLTKFMNVRIGGAYGGGNMRLQLEMVYAGLDILVATPGRLYDLVLKGALKLKAIKKLVIDEVDEMLHLGFRPQLTRILDILPPKRQNLLFSATMTDDVEELMDIFFRNPTKIEAAPTGTPLENIEQIGYNIPNFFTKLNLLELLLTEDKSMTKVLVFAETKYLADLIYERLNLKFPDKIGVIHSNKSQNNRFNAVNRFKDNSFNILIATDLIARGIDISEVSHVINLDTPDIAENYIHRIGRTGRADKKGIAITFISKKEKEFQKAIEKLMKFKIPILPTPENLEISDNLLEIEKDKVEMKLIEVRRPKKETVGASHHEKSEKNKKVNRSITRADTMKAKYKKPITRGDKNQNKKKR
jgi:ATP-dependent RNA helicase RhlE